MPGVPSSELRMPFPYHLRQRATTYRVVARRGSQSFDFSRRRSHPGAEVQVRAAFLPRPPARILLRPTGPTRTPRAKGVGIASVRSVQTATDSKTGHAPLVRNQLALSPPLRFAATCLSYSIVICLAQVGPGAFCAQVFPQFGRNFRPERKAKFGRNLGVGGAQ